MSTFNWKSFLTEWSAELIASHDPDDDPLPNSVIASGWLGYDGATDAQIAVLEARLGKTLPPSYKQFLQTTNGWQPTSYHEEGFFSTEDVDWFHDLNEGWVRGWTEGYNVEPVESVSDSEYFIYGDEQSTVTLRPEYLKTALQISDVFDGSVYLLNPQVITPDGEWEAWHFANWLPGAARYQSFRELIEATRKQTSNTSEYMSRQIKAHDSPEALIEKLPKLIQTIEEKAKLYARYIPKDDAMGIRALGGGAHHEGTIAVLHEVASRIAALRGITNPAVLRQALAQIAGEYESEARKPPSINQIMGNLMGMLSNSQKALDTLRELGRPEGCRQAAGYIRWFLNE